MAVQTQNHVHLQGTDDRPWETDDAPDNTYKVLGEGGYRREPRAAVSLDTALDGTVHVHRLAVGGVPVVYDNYGHTLKVTHEELIELLSDVGKNVDFVDSVHPDEGESHAAYVDEKVLAAVEVRNFDRMLAYYLVRVALEDV